MTTATTEVVQWHVEQKEGYRLYWSGSHREGDFVQAYVPDSLSANPKVIVYLHGFSLCLPEFYAQHLEALVKQGHVVVFPDFQQSTYPDPDQPAADPPNFGTWLASSLQFALAAIRRRDRAETDVLPGCRSQQLPDPTPGKQLRVSLAVSLIFAAIYLVYFIFQRTYGKNLLTLISTVARSLLHQPSDWAEDAIALTESAIAKLGEDYPDFASYETIVFGHSLGGLLALSWQQFVAAESPLSPNQIFTADPAPTTDLGIPRPAVWILKLFRVPFADAPLTIQETGSSLTVPVTIVHGASDRIVPPQTWVRTQGTQYYTNFDAIASDSKAIYFSLSNEQQEPPLVAFHNQAVTNTTYYDDDLFEHFGGVKEHPNAYNFQLIWPWLIGVVEENLQPDRLPGRLPPKTIEVSDSLPPAPFPWRGFSRVFLFMGIGSAAVILLWSWAV